MKIIPLHTNEKKLLKEAVAGNSKAQRMLYDNYAPKMLGVCRQYIKDLQFAEDVMIDGFIKVFRNLARFQHRGSFEGWVRKIMVRESITHLRKRQFVVFDDETVSDHGNQGNHDASFDDVEHIQALIDALPEGYKMVFLLYAIEGYKHQEIAEMLNISEGTSKSQLSKARKQLQENLTLKGVMPKGLGNK